MEHLKTHLRIVATFFLREMATRFGKKPGGYLWAFLEPIAYISLMTALFSLLARLPAVGESYPLFFATGYLAFNLYRGMERYLTSVVGSNKNLIMYPIVAPIDAVVARFVLQAVTSIVVCTVIFFVIIHNLLRPIDIYWPSLLEATILAWMMATGVAMINIILFAKYPLYQQAYSIVSRPMFMLSGAFFVPGALPSPAREIFLANPICQMVILFREGFYDLAGTDGLDLPYLTEISVIVLFSGMLVFTLGRGAKARW